MNVIGKSDRYQIEKRAQDKYRENNYSKSYTGDRMMMMFSVLAN